VYYSGSSSKSGKSNFFTKSSKSSKSSKSRDKYNSLLNQQEVYNAVGQVTNEAGARIWNFDISWVLLTVILPFVI